ncbi:MAG: purine operon repressor [Thermoanaerobacteraceae bacterium]|jgi:purine operon repressor|uniref:Pur operon repressor n=1 Tax=Biomaibacter acetigenes TaxID=2316383 RepID=A0A3G2R2L5_9FIRM|nr:pur operon repressor [Biomaibacter acetigenes]MDK2878559.1 purine operon repressor [Thermoanaerobacteraceae bacterium]RKL64608.1 pur operon repressor [Thermoanaerobacteraceae bacterium SP2]AYO29287.1 pur operon repressor [Biomaibacter acetigenes]MDN5301578.1 purine operon repressor [Thermoanaerobacteraceae bacterium]MDN5312123.1 purine operon repressor [Thermoanaerobacteraceae bacterium]
MRRGERLALLSKILCENPNRVISLKFFSERLDAAKSSISEDLNIIKNAFMLSGEGELSTIAGAGGGVRYRIKKPESEIKSFVETLCENLKDQKRIIPGGYIYMTDVIFSPEYSVKIGEIFAQIFMDREPTCVLTVETKGIPIALMTARALDVPLVVARRDSRVTEGPSVNISYVSGTGQKIQNMSLPKRALSENARVLIVDDFMKGGGTARGMMELSAEFNAEVVGVAVLVATGTPQCKLVKDYTSLMVLDGIDTEKGIINIRPDKITIS